MAIDPKSVVWDAPDPKKIVWDAAPEPGSEIPQWARNNPRLYGAGQAARHTLGPLIEGLSAAGGAVLGTPLGPAGNVGGAALGYGIGKGFNRLADQALGNEAPVNALQAMTRGAGDVVEGAAWQAGGNVVGQQVIPAVGRGVSAVSGKVMDLGGKQKAAKIARDALGDDLTKVVANLTDQPLYGQTTAGELTANVNNPTWHALVERGLGRDPKFTQAVALAAKNSDKDAIIRLAGGNTQTAAIGAQRTAKDALNKELIPVLDTELGAANIAGNLKPKLDAESARMAAAAAAKVEDVRRMTAAGERAATRAHTTTGQAAETAVPGYPRQPGRYTYMGDLEKQAERVAQQAADASLPFGEASRFSKAASESLEAHGLRPLTADSIIDKLRQVKTDPKLAGLSEIDAAIAKLGDDLTQWTKAGGVIDARAVDSIRKNSVNGAIQKMHPNMDATQQKRLAASVMKEVSPRFIQAIENAGGTGYGDYLKAYAQGAQKIDQQKMGAKVLDLYNTRPASAAKVIEGDAPQRVEKVFGPGKYDIRNELAPESVNALDKVARGVRIRESTATQAKDGQEALLKLMEDNTIKFKLPWLANVKATVTNAALARMEEKLGESTMKTLTEAFKTGKGTQELLNRLPASERSKVLKALSNLKPSQNAINVGTAASKNALQELTR